MAHDEIDEENASIFVIIAARLKSGAHREHGISSSINNRHLYAK